MHLTKLENFILSEINDAICNKFLPPLTEELKLELTKRIVNHWYLLETYNDIVLEIYHEFLDEKGIPIHIEPIKPISFEKLDIK